ncbi:MAG: protein-glutamate O-methyltransferase CheR [Planctomycetes bacterium]|nr:protein-glutamate O-methyltransferase CheR [Planctomycetota bacterium]
MMTLTDREYCEIRDLVYDNFGINLTDKKRSLIVGRLQKVVRTLGLNSIAEYVEHVKSDKSGQALVELVNRISTNHTFFYREADHFDFFSQRTLPEAVAACQKENSKDIRVWCAGCSTGEEPYMLVMLMMEFFGSDYDKWDAGLLSTDISMNALRLAQVGTYSPERMTNLPEVYKRKYFKQQLSGDWSVIDRVKKELTLRQFNLMNKTFPFKKKFHAIFCRNVMIYFDRPTRMALVEKFYEHTRPGGYLFIGHSESLGRNECPYDYIQPAVYRKKIDG